MHKNNMAKITGTVIAEPQYDHETAGAVFYRTILATNRKSGYADEIPVIFRKGMVDENKIYYGANISVEGNFRSVNMPAGEKRKLILYLFAEQISDAAQEDDNYIFLHGFICRQPVYRETPSGRQITDLLVAVNRPGGKSDYIPCICWAGNARYAKNLAVGSRIELTGRIQSREYVKKLDEEQQETRVAYEVSASRIYMIEEGE
ncbi:single-stranded DNA-binding protein [uncultured Eubacterium sp.]|uniref:single-stranded DNA-binding protein n=1 Tax=uncultured Eubacterium sp. TaxID=165185 RepID=UPI0025955458|nr:single-stranded DNA-binding protein [uncultured Eubacterium sp.]